MADTIHCANGKECMEDRWEPPIRKKREEEPVGEIKNFVRFLSAVSTLSMIVSDQAAQLGYDDIAERCYNNACDLCDEAASILAE